MLRSHFHLLAVTLCSWRCSC